MIVSTPFHVLTMEPVMVTDTREEYEKHMANFATQYLDIAKAAARAVGVSCDRVHVEHEHPYQAIIDTAKRQGCDLIVMASRGRARDFGDRARERDRQGRDA